MGVICVLERVASCHSSESRRSVTISLIHQPNQEDIMAADSKTTTDHDEIRRWVEEHDGKPASVRGTESSSEAGVLRIDFPGGAGEDQLEHLEWDAWFEKF